MDVNVKSIYLLSREVIPIMAKSRRRFDHQYGFRLGHFRRTKGCGVLRVERRRSAADQGHGD